MKQRIKHFYLKWTVCAKIGHHSIEAQCPYTGNTYEDCARCWTRLRIYKTEGSK